MIWNHPAIGQEHVGSELHGDEFIIDLDHNALDPPTHTLAAALMVTEDLDCITHVEGFRDEGRVHIGER